MFGCFCVVDFTDILRVCIDVSSFGWMNCKEEKFYYTALCWWPCKTILQLCSRYIYIVEPVEWNSMNSRYVAVERYVYSRHYASVSFSLFLTICVYIECSKQDKRFFIASSSLFYLFRTSLWFLARALFLSPSLFLFSFALLLLSLLDFWLKNRHRMENTHFFLFLVFFWMRL